VAKSATSPYNLQNYKKIFIYALNKQELRKFLVTAWEEWMIGGAVE